MRKGIVSLSRTNMFESCNKSGYDCNNCYSVWTRENGVLHRINTKHHTMIIALLFVLYRNITIAKGMFAHTKQENSRMIVQSPQLPVELEHTEIQS